MKAASSNQNLLSPKSKTIAIMQLTRFGDVIQTLQSVSNLKKLYPQYRVVLIARSQFARPLNFLIKNTFDHAIFLDTKNIFQNKETLGIKNSTNKLNEFLNEISEENIEVLVNLSFSKSSCYLSSLISATHKIGPYYDFSNRMVINDKWSQMLYSTVMRGSYNPFSLVDLFKNIIGIKEDSTKNKHLSLVKTEKKKNIIIHPFASAERKMWKTEKWVEVIYKTLKENEGYSVTIVGAKNETLKSQLIVENPLLKTFSNRITNLTGKTSIEELYNEVSEAVLFIGHDSMVGHIAALTNTTSFTVSLGSVRPYETTPYQANAYNLAPRTKCFPCFPSDKCSYFQCHHDIPYQVISSAIKELIEKKELTAEWANSSISHFHQSSINLYRSTLSDGKQKIVNLLDAHQDAFDIYKSLYRVTWSYLISEQEEVVAFPKLNASTHQELLNGMQGLQHLYELADFGKKYSRYILEEIASTSPSVHKIKEYSKKIDEIDHLQKLVQKTSPHLAPIIDYFTIRKANLFGENIVKLTESSFLVFEEMGDLCRIMYELIESTISEYKLNNKSTTHRVDQNK